MSQHESGSSVKPGMQQMQQPSELPTWLESLRPDVRPPSFTKVPSPFNAANLIEDEALPLWMRQRHEGEDEDKGKPSSSANSSNAMGTPKPASSNTSGLRPASASAPNTDESSFERGFSAGSLIDESALPSWMQPNDVPGVPSTPPRHIDASSLVEPGAMPDWMKDMQQQRPAPSAPFSQQPSSKQPALPAHGFSAGELIDRQALPGWMTQQDGPSGSGPRVSLSGVQPDPQQGIPASSLLDSSSLPAWMRESEQGSGPRSTSGTTNPPWQMPQVQQAPPPQQPMPPMPPQPNNISASSLIEQDSLPPWLRPAEQGARPGYAPNAGNIGGIGNGRPPRADVRVPSRPRGELGVQDSSTGAASAFASMLGVASAAPNFPAPPPNVPGAPPYAPQDAANAAPYQPPHAPPGPTGMAPGSNSPYGVNGTVPPPQPPPYSQYPPQNVAQGGYPPNGQPGMSAMPAMPPMPQPGTPNMQTMQNIQNVQQPPFMGVSSMPPGAIMGNQQGQQGQQASGQSKPAKRGLFEAIRNWLSR